MKKYFLVFLLLSGLASAVDEQIFPDPQKFPLPIGYSKNVQFWMRVYGEWDDDKMIIHDAENMDIVFDVMQIPEENTLLRAAALTNVKRRAEEIRNILLQLDKNPDSYKLSADYKKIYELYLGIPNSKKFRRAAENLRVQQGIKNRFRKGLEQMPVYLEQIKVIFTDEGLPEELAYLPLVESSFNNQSLSKTRAAGIWQFMPGTGRLFMTVNSDLDERLDPSVATRAAARYLKRSYNMFHSWPVAITSYNHGQQGMQKAIDTLGSREFMDIFSNYSGKYFGFASKNFYAEFLAACKVMNNAEKYFGAIQSASPLTAVSVTLTRPLAVSSILMHSTLTREDLRTYNPALQSAVVFGRRPIPAGYRLHLPRGRFADPEAFIAQLRAAPTPSPATMMASASPSRSKSAKIKSSRGAAANKSYVVRRGDTLFSISRKFATTVEDLRKRNGLNHSHIFPGQRLFIGVR